MKIRCVWEHNGNDTLLYAENFPGAFTRGTDLKTALKKMPDEVCSYARWAGIVTTGAVDVEIVQEKSSNLNIADADSDVIFESETGAMPKEEYEYLKALALKSAEDFYALFLSVENKSAVLSSERSTFYGKKPQTAQEMYDHTKNVNSYYFAEIDVGADNDGTIYECRKRGFELLEQKENFLTSDAAEGSYGELWSVKKALRRFIWHDRIHAKALYRAAIRVFGEISVNNSFKF